MSRIIFVIAIIFIVGVVGWLFWARPWADQPNDMLSWEPTETAMLDDNQGQLPATTNEMSDDQANQPVRVDSEETMPTAVARYVDYSPAAYAAATGQRRILFFHAPWCPTCKVANADLQANASQLPADVVVFKTDYDSQAALKKKYGITYQHTFVLVDAQDNAIAKWNGGGVAEITKQIAL